MAAQVRVQGLAQLRRELRAFQGDAEDLKAANSAAAALVAHASASKAPKRSGSLAASGRGNRAVGKAVVTFGGSRVPYAGPIHWGWPARGIEPQPFVTDAAQATQGQWLPLYEADLQRAADKVKGARSA